jgi:hypothetical protein
VRRPGRRLVQRLGVARQLFETDAGERDTEFVLGIGHGGKHDFVQKVGAGVLCVAVINRSGGAQNIIGGHLATVARQFVTAARSADAMQNSAANERLQHRLEMPWRQAVTRGKRFCGNRLSLRLHCHVNDGGDGEDCFAGKQRHGRIKRRCTRIGLLREVIYYDCCVV